MNGAVNIATMMKVVGSPISPYVRKVLFALNIKNVAWENDPLVAFYGNEKFSRISPLRRIPVLLGSNGEVVVDSTVIVEYLEDVYPAQSCFPNDPVERSKCRFLEEYADTRLSDVLLWSLWQNVVINKNVFGEKPSEHAVRMCLEKDCPEVLKFVDSQIPNDCNSFLFGSYLTIADVSLAQPLTNALWLKEFSHSGLVEQFPKVFSFVERVNAHTSISKCIEAGRLAARTSIPEQRNVLEKMGWPTCNLNLTADLPRRGIARL